MGGMRGAYRPDAAAAELQRARHHRVTPRREPVRVPDTETDAMDLFRSPGIAPPPLPIFASRLAWSRRYGHVRHLREPDVAAANEDDAPQGVDQDFEEYDFE